MLSYRVPVEEKPPQARAPVAKNRLALELAHGNLELEAAPRRVRADISKDSSTNSFASDITISSSTPTGALDKPKHKLHVNGTKQTTLKRVSFGSSKGSMVETLIYESPLQEEPESSPPPTKTHETAFNYPLPEDDSERSKVRVFFYQGVRPQCVSSAPSTQQETHNLYVDVAAATTSMADHTMYNRQVSTESGWDNPFRPDGDLSREADEIVSLIKGGKPITPTPQATPQIADEIQEKINANHLHAEAPSSPQTKVANPVQQSTPKVMNGTKNGGTGADARPGPVEVQRAPPPEPQQAEHITIKKKPKCKCCIIQ